MTAPLTVLSQHVHAVTEQPSPRLSVLAAATLYVAVAGAGLLAAPALTGVEVARRLRAVVLGAVGAAYVALLAGSAALGGLSGTAFLARAGLLEGGVEHHLGIAVHLVAAAIWIGGVAHLALFATVGRGRVHLAAGIRRFSPYAIGSALVLALSGYLLLLMHRVALVDLPDSPFGALVLTKAGLLAVASGLGVAHRRARTKTTRERRPRLLRFESLSLATALVFAVVLAGLEPPQPTVQIAAPGLAVVEFDDAPEADVFVTALAAQEGAVRNLSDTSLRLVDRATHQAHQMAPGEVARVALDGGVAHLELTSGQTTRTAVVRAASPAPPVLAGAATADPTGWLDFQLGRSLGLAAGGRDRAVAVDDCPTSTVVAEGRAYGRALLRSGADQVAPVVDGSSRARDMVRGLLHSGVRRTARADARAVLVATDSSRATSVLRQLAADRGRVDVVYLAPWLLDARVLSLLTSVRLPPLVVASTVDAMSPLADDYRAALAAAGAGSPPSMAGLLGYRSVLHPASTADRQLTLYSAAPVGFLPGVLNVGHDHGSSGWFANGSLVPTSRPTSITAAGCGTTST